MNGHRRAWRVAGTGLTAVALALGTAASASAILAWVPTTTTAGNISQPPQVTTTTEHHTYPRPASHVDIDLPAGGVSLTAGDPRRVEVERRLSWSASRPTIAESWGAGDTLRAHVECPSLPAGERCSVDYEMRLPPEAGATVRVAGGAVAVRGIHGPLSVDAAAGDVTGSGLRSQSVEVTLDAGRVSLGFAAPPDHVRVEATTGSVTIEVPRGDAYRVEVDTMVGAQQVGIVHDPAAARVIEVRTTVGEVRIRYAS